MESKEDISLTEVHEMKRKNLEDFKKSGSKSYSTYIADEMKKIGYKPNYFIKEPEQGYKSK